MPETPGGFALPPLVRFSGLVLQALGDAREEIDALNVYPVPDGDTGTNLFLTFEAADRALQESLSEQGGEDSADLRTAVVAYARGLLLGARGNSGVIMAALVGGLFRRIGRSTPEERPAAAFAEGLVAATEAAYAAVGRPVEGTILSVARAASEAATAVVEDLQIRTADVLKAASKAAREALARTPEQLEVLRNAGVVDAGGRGLCLVLDAAEAAFTGKRLLRRQEDRGRRSIPMPLPTDDLTEGGPAYEVMYLLDADDEAILPLRTKLDALGDSLVVVGGDGLWNVHVHVDDVGAAIEAGIGSGRPHRVKVTHFAEQAAAARETAMRGAMTGRAVVVVAFGPGLGSLFEEAGAIVVPAEVDRRPSTGELLVALQRSGADEAALIPNDKDVVPTAQAAARLAEAESGMRVSVIPTSTQVAGLAALAVHEPGRPFQQDLTEMTAAARHCRSGAVTVAVRQAITSAGLCEPGDVLGAVEGDFVVVGADLYDVAVDVMTKMLGGGGELFTVIAGVDGDELAQRCRVYLEAEHPTIDVLVYDGGQDRYPLLFGVE